MVPSKYITQKKLIKVGDIVQFTDIFITQHTRLGIKANKNIAIVIDERLFNKDMGKLIMFSNGAKEWVRKERIKTIFTLEEL